jgi:hypothetical protein
MRRMARHNEVNAMFRIPTIILALALVALATAAGAQSRGRDRQEVARAQGVAVGQLPPADMCRVWYNGQPPGRQPRATSCRQAESIVARDRNARVIYGTDAYERNTRYGRNGVYGSNTGTYPYPDNDRGVSRIPGRNRAPSGVYDRIYPNAPGGRYNDTAFENGYRDGREQGLEDGRDRDRFDATRHGRYRSGDRGYINSYGDKTRYKNIYRDGFQAGYQDGYREGNYRR